MEMSFAQEKLLILLLGLPFIFAILFFSRSLESKKIARLGPGITKYLGFRWSSLHFTLRNLCFLLGIGALLLSLAGPRLGFEYKEVPHGGRDIMVLFDVSRSMNANDVSPSRMERAKRKILDVISGLRGERIGIVAFAGKAFVHCPLTDDKSMLTLFVNSLDDELISYQGTNLADAVRIAGESLEKGASAQSTGKSLLVITDGEDFSGDSESVKSIVAAKTLDLNILGVGTPEGSPIPNKGGGLVKDRSGNVVISKLAESELTALASGVGGLYVRSTASDQDVKAILDKVTAPTDAEEMSREKVWNEYFQHALAIGLLFLVLGWLITPYQAASVFLFLTFCFFPVFSSALADGFGLFKQKKFEEAALYFEKQASTKDNHHLELYNAAVAHYEAMDYDAAVSGFKSASESKNEGLKKDALYNLGNTYVAQNKLEEALSPYQEVLKLDGSFVKAKENLEWVMKQLQDQKEKKQNQQNQNDKNQSDNSQSEKNQSSDQNSKSSEHQKPPSSESQNSNSTPKGDSGSGKDDQKPSSPEGQKPDENSQKNGQKPERDSAKGSNKKEGDISKPEDQAASKSGGEQEKKSGSKEASVGEVKQGTPLQGADEAKALLRQVDENMKVWGVKPRFEDSKKDKDW